MLVQHNDVTSTMSDVSTSVQMTRTVKSPAELITEQLVRCYQTVLLTSMMQTPHTCHEHQKIKGAEKQNTYHAGDHSRQLRWSERDEQAAC
jgi:hypothetical protein